MNGERLLKFLISLFIVLQVLGFVFQIPFLNAYCNPILFALVIVFYLISSKRTNALHIIILLIFFSGELIRFQDVLNTIKFEIMVHTIVYILLFYFLYYNHKSFKYNNRDVFTLVLGSSLYTVIFFLAYSILREPMGELSILGFLHLLLLYILLIVGAMHYINIRSEKSLWFFLSMLNFAFSDFMLLIDRFYLQSNELKVLMLICQPLALVFLVNYMISKSVHLKSDEFEGF
ncbi:hypothetical protein [Aquimarina sp. MMG016]|uniref:hypothetical protein n=1 Tax=Aquimarina sp. MMG016 TaxID=2822690 RepID=UPI001B3A3886|nr:hypothetical protein [Aquimarina sp. MMG016]MBQ4821182.1 hypothetical protein [Aquimarina sp. MMG016]